VIRKVLAGAVGLVGMIGAANAADIPARPYYKAPPPIAVFNWTGFYIGGQIGGAWGDHDRDTGAFQNSYTSDGIIGGVHAGYNWQGIGSPWVIGIEVDFNGADVSGDDAGVGGTFDQSRLRWVGSVRGRLGWARDTWMVYTTAGWAFGNIRHFNPAGVPANNNNDVDGFTVGAGVEWAFAPRWSARLEYRYYDLEDYTLAPAGLAAFNVENTYHSVTFGVSYRF
jgi:outer membrane immunogenic protein